MALVAGAAITPAAAADQHVVLYSANDDTVNRIVAEGFKKETGIQVDVVSTGSGVLFQRIASEKGNPQADVVWGVSTALLKRNQAFFEPYAVKGRDAVPAEYRDPSDLWIGTNLQVVTIDQNTKSVDAASGPKSWQDLLDPKWKGKIAYTDPANSGFSYAAATVLLQPRRRRVLQPMRLRRRRLSGRVPVCRCCSASIRIWSVSLQPGLRRRCSGFQRWGLD